MVDPMASRRQAAWSTMCLGHPRVITAPSTLSCPLHKPDERAVPVNHRG